MIKDQSQATIPGIRNPERCITGIATPYYQRSVDGHTWTPQSFDAFAASGWAVPLRLNHGPVLSGGYLQYVGKVRAYAHVTQPTPGLLILGELDEGTFGDEALCDLRHLDSLHHFPSLAGLSILANVDDETGDAWLTEISICHRPVFPDAQILAAGERALTVWNLLSEQKAAA